MTKPSVSVTIVDEPQFNSKRVRVMMDTKGLRFMESMVVSNDLLDRAYNKDETMASAVRIVTNRLEKAVHEHTKPKAKQV